MTTYIFLGGLAGIVAIRRGDRLQVFLQAAVAAFLVNALVVSVFSLLGARDLRGVLELWFASGRRRRAQAWRQWGRSPCSDRSSGS